MVRLSSVAAASAVAVHGSAAAGLQGVVTIVTGASGGIGSAVAQELASAGASVVLTGRRQAALERVRGDIGASGTSAFAISCDVTDEQSVQALFDQTMSTLGPCELLVNAAGISGAGGPTDALAVADFQAALSANVVGPFLCARAAFRQMRASGNGGRIINVGSISAWSPRPNSAAYTTTKFALDGLTRSLALDGRAHNIAVGIVHPGNVETSLLSADEIERRRETEGFITPEAVAASVLHMASLPPTANVLELVVLPTRQPLVGRG